MAEKRRNKNVATEDSSLASPPKLSEEELKRIRQIVSEDEMRCMKCHKQYCTISYLHRHAVRHLGWRRFKCKLCKFTAYNRSECTTHLRKVHSTKTLGVRDMNPYIHDLEPEKIKPELSTLTRVERPNLQRSNSNQSSSNGENYNISTRRNTRVFNTKPYMRNEDDEENENDDNPNSQKTWQSRKGTHSKLDLVKRKLDTEDSEDSKGPSKRRRRNSDEDSTSSEETEVVFVKSRKNSKADGEVSEQIVSNKKAPTKVDIVSQRTKVKMRRMMWWWIRQIEGSPTDHKNQ